MSKRRLSNFNFEAEGSHIALVHKEQGGPANGHDYALICKATNDIKEQDINKASEVQVTMNIVDFLCKFFNLWYEDAIVLAAVFGYQPVEDAYSFDESAAQYDNYLQERVDAIKIMKSVVLDSVDIGKAVSMLSAKDYMSILKCQEQFEKNYEAAVEKAASYKKASVDIAEEFTVAKATNSPSVENNNTGDDMSEFVTKAVHDTAIEEAIQKAKGEVQVELQKALDKIAEFEKAQVESVQKMRKEAIAAVEKDAEKAEALFKSLEAVSDEAFEVVVKSLQAKEEKLEDSDLFVQKSKEASQEEMKPKSFADYLPKKNK